MVIFRHFNLVIDFCISARNSINNHFFTRCPLTKSFSMLFNSTRNNPQTRMFCYTYSSVLPFVVYYPLLCITLCCVLPFVDSFHQFVWCKYLHLGETKPLFAQVLYGCSYMIHIIVNTKEAVM